MIYLYSYFYIINQENMNLIFVNISNNKNCIILIFLNKNFRHILNYYYTKDI